MSVTEQPTTTTETVWCAFQHRLRVFIAKRVKRSSDVEDVLQEVFLRVHQKLATVRQRESVAAWLFQVTRNAIADHYRRDRPATKELEEDRTETAGAGTDDDRALSELSQCLDPMIAALPKHYGEALVLTDVQGETQYEAARRSGLSLSGMKSRVQRARGQLKDMLLACCRVELDRHGGIVEYAVRDPEKAPCEGSCSRT